MAEPETPWEGAPLDKKTYYRERYDEKGNALSRPIYTMQSWIASLSILVLVIIFLVGYVPSEVFWILGIGIFAASFFRESKTDLGEQPLRSGNYESNMKKKGMC
jgi:hypothetical protein